MHVSALRPWGLAALAAGLLVLLLPMPAARADDAAMKAGVVPALQALAKKESAAASGLRRVRSRGRSAVENSRKKVRSARRSARVFAVLLAAQQPSTPNGQQAKDLLLKGLKLEAMAYQRADLALKSYGRGNTARANRILRRADRAILRAVGYGKKAIQILVTL
jgi:hypothetical protein